MIKKQVVFIGGGDVLSGKQDKIFLSIFDKFNKETIKLYYLPLALFNDKEKLKKMPDYMKLLKDYFKKLNKKIDFDWAEIKNKETVIEDKIKLSDIVFLSGGDTNFLISKLQKTKLGNTLISEYTKGKLIIGNSAGCLALAHIGYSYFGSEKKEYHGIGMIRNLIPMVHWKKEYKMKHQSENTSMIMLEENKGCIIVNDNSIKVLN